jgi:TRAP-type C4-dicarboxylate transport system permease large subunit
VGSVALVLVIVFVLLLVMNVPIAVSIAMAAFVAIVAQGVDPSIMLASKMANGVNSFALLAIPFFILSGHLMGRGGMARRLIDFANAMVGMFPGGLAYVNTLTCMMFGSISGSAAAAVSSVGGFMIPEMNRKGYGREFNVAVTTTAATTGLLIPPSNIMIVYSVAAGSVSIAAMFMAGFLPGIITGIFIMFVCGYFAFRYKYGAGESGSFLQIIVSFVKAVVFLIPSLVVIAIMLGLMFVAFSYGSLLGQLFGISDRFKVITGYVVGLIVWLAIMIVCRFIEAHFRNPERGSFRHSFVSCISAFPSLLLVVIVIGGILKGIFTATEAAAVAVFYAFVVSVGVYREIKPKELPDILKQTGITTAVVMLLIGASSGMSWIMTMANIPQTVSTALVNLSDNPIVILLTINILLLFVGTFMDMTPAVLIFTPIFLPVVTSLGMHQIHFGIMMIANLCIGLCTPPVGTCLFIGCGVGKTTIAKVTKTMLPFFGSMIVALMVITYVPQTSLWLPAKTGVIKTEEVNKAYEAWNQGIYGGGSQETQTTE